MKTNTAYFVDRLNTYPHCARCFTLLSVAIPKAKPLLKQEKVATTFQKSKRSHSLYSYR